MLHAVCMKQWTVTFHSGQNILAGHMWVVFVWHFRLTSTEWATEFLFRRCYTNLLLFASLGSKSALISFSEMSMSAALIMSRYKIFCIYLNCQFRNNLNFKVTVNIFNHGYISSFCIKLPFVNFKPYPCLAPAIICKDLIPSTSLKAPR